MWSACKESDWIPLVYIYIHCILYIMYIMFVQYVHAYIIKCIYNSICQYIYIYIHITAIGYVVWLSRWEWREGGTLSKPTRSHVPGCKGSNLILGTGWEHSDYCLEQQQKNTIFFVEATFGVGWVLGSFERISFIKIRTSSASRTKHRTDWFGSFEVDDFL